MNSPTPINNNLYFFVGTQSRTTPGMQPITYPPLTSFPINDLLTSQGIRLIIGFACYSNPKSVAPYGGNALYRPKEIFMSIYIAAIVLETLRLINYLLLYFGGCLS